MSPSPWTSVKVKFWKFQKGYGFAYRDSTYKDIFLHASVLDQVGYTKDLPKEKEIEVRFIETEKGLCAVDIRDPK